MKNPSSSLQPLSHLHSTLQTQLQPSHPIHAQKGQPMQTSPCQLSRPCQLSSRCLHPSSPIRSGWTRTRPRLLTTHPILGPHLMTPLRSPQQQQHWQPQGQRQQQHQQEP